MGVTRLGFVGCIGASQQSRLGSCRSCGGQHRSDGAETSRGCRGHEAGDQGCGLLCVFRAHLGGCREDSALGLKTEVRWPQGPVVRGELLQGFLHPAAFWIPSPNVYPFLTPRSTTSCAWSLPPPLPIRSYSVCLTSALFGGKDALSDPGPRPPLCAWWQHKSTRGPVPLNPWQLFVNCSIKD